MHETDLAAIGRVKAGDCEAFSALVERHSRSVFRLAYRITGNETDAEEVVQEAFLKAYKEIQRYESRASFSTWLHSIAANCALDTVRKSKRSMQFVGRDEDSDPAAEVPSASPSPEREASSVLLSERIEAALGELSAQERTAFVLRHYEGVPLDEIGQTLGLSENATKQSVFRAIKKLRKILAPWVSMTCNT